VISSGARAPATWLLAIGVLGGLVSPALSACWILIIARRFRQADHGLVPTPILAVMLAVGRQRSTGLEAGWAAPDALIIALGLVHVAAWRLCLIALASFLGGPTGLTNHAVVVAPEKTAERVARNMKDPAIKILSLSWPRPPTAVGHATNPDDSLP